MKQTGMIRVGLASFAAVLAVSCGNPDKGKTDNSMVQEDPVVSVETVAARDVPQTSVYTSTVEPYVKNNIAPQSAMRITDINVEVGDFVRKGQVLAELDRIQLQQAELQLKNNEIEYERLKGLYEAGGLSKSDLDAMELSYRVSRTTYENLLENTVLRSPVDGVITARNYDEGDMYAMSSPIYVVEQITPVKLLVAISEVDYTRINKNDSVEIAVDAFPGRSFSGRVSRIYPTVDPATHTFSVEIIVPNKDRVLRPGMFARVTVLFGTNHNPVIPDIAVVKQTGSGERFVYVLNSDGTVTYRAVRLGRRMDYEYEVLEGLSEGERVVTRGQIRLKDGVRVKISKNEK